MATVSSISELQSVFNLVDREFSASGVDCLLVGGACYFVCPPHLEMDDYAEFVAASLAQTPPEKAARQKAIEEQVAVSFSLNENDVVSATCVLPHLRTDTP